MASMSTPALPPRPETDSDPPPRPPSKGAAGMKVQITHDALIDYMLANPRHSRRQVAEAFGFKSTQSITIIINSDAFQARYNARRSDIIDPLLTATIDERIKGLADKSMEILERKLENSEDGNFALKVFDSTSRAAGYGNKNPQAVLQTQFVVQLPGPAVTSEEWSKKFAATDAPVLRVDPALAPSEENNG